MTAATPRPLAKLRALLAGLQREVDDAKPQMRALLLAGDNTAGARAAASAAAKRIIEIGSELASLEAQQSRARQAAILKDAATIAAEALRKIDANVAALQPPVLA